MSTYTGSPWTPERDDLLRQLRKDDVSFAQIARELNCGLSRSACVGRASRIGLKSTKVHSSRSGPKYSTSLRRTDNHGNVTKSVNRKRRRISGGMMPPSEIVELQASIQFLGIPFMDLELHHCRFPNGEGLSTLFCGQPALEGQSYCAHCYGITHAIRLLNISDEERLRRSRQALRNNEARRAKRAA